MKKLLFILMVTCYTVSTYAQDDLKARIEFEAAETAFADSNFKQAYEKLDKAEKLLGKWSARISYLKIVSLNQFVRVSKKDDPYTQELRKEVKLYMNYAKTNKNDIDMEKFKEVYVVEERLANAFDSKIHLETPGVIAAENAIKSNDTTKAIQLFLKEAESNPWAMYTLGFYYYTGWYVNKDYAKAIEWLEKSLWLGITISAVELAKIHIRGGNGAGRNYKKAFHYAKIAADNNKGEGWRILGLIYENGAGLNVNYQEALKCYLEASKDSDCNVDVLIADLYFKENTNIKDYKKAFEWYNKCLLRENAKHGYSMYQIGYMFENGLGVEKDYSVAIDWYTKAAEKEHKDAYERLAYFYENGLGVKRDKKLAAEWREKAKK